MPAIILAYGGKSPVIHPDAFVATGAVVTGDVEIGADSGIWFGCVLRGDVNQIRIGCRSNIQDGTVVHCTRNGFACLIGDDITVGHGAILHACTLESGSFVGMGAVVLDGAVVERGAMVAAGALVAPGKRVKSGELWAGNPAKLMRALSAEDLAFFPKSVAHYVDLARDYRQAGA
jgi:carbonic anhydrase/acetyltransferase-like protein (isoleucine patch superfamily)